MTAGLFEERAASGESTVEFCEERKIKRNQFLLTAKVVRGGESTMILTSQELNLFLGSPRVVQKLRCKQVRIGSVV